MAAQSCDRGGACKDGGAKRRGPPPSVHGCCAPAVFEFVCVFMNEHMNDNSCQTGPLPLGPMTTNARPLLYFFPSALCVCAPFPHCGFAYCALKHCACAIGTAIPAAILSRLAPHCSLLRLVIHVTVSRSTCPGHSLALDNVLCCCCFSPAVRHVVSACMSAHDSLGVHTPTGRCRQCSTCVVQGLASCRSGEA